MGSWPALGEVAQKARKDSEKENKPLVRGESGGGGEEGEGGKVAGKEKRGRQVEEGAQWEVGEEGELSRKAVKAKLMVTVKSSPAAEKVCTLFIHHVNLLLCAVHLLREKAVQLVC